jgi:hypothetical protein
MSPRSWFKGIVMRTRQCTQCRDEEITWDFENNITGGGLCLAHELRRAIGNIEDLEARVKKLESEGVSMSIGYLCKWCARQLRMTGSCAVNEVGRKRCTICEDNYDNLIVVDKGEMQIALKRWEDICETCGGHEEVLDELAITPVSPEPPMKSCPECRCGHDENI